MHFKRKTGKLQFFSSFLTSDLELLDSNSLRGKNSDQTIVQQNVSSIFQESLRFEEKNARAKPMLDEE